MASSRVMRQLLAIVEACYDEPEVSGPDDATTPDLEHDHAAYPAAWMRRLREDTRAIAAAAGAAQKAADWILGRTATQEVAA